MFIVFQMITNHRSHTQQKDGCNHTAGEFLPRTADAFGWRWCSCGVQGLNRTIRLLLGKRGCFFCMNSLLQSLHHGFRRLHLFKHSFTLLFIHQPFPPLLAVACVVVLCPEAAASELFQPVFPTTLQFLLSDTPQSSTDTAHFDTSV